jgi:orotidine-5'-phosphate decarboxylase
MEKKNDKSKAKLCIALDCEREKALRIVKSLKDVPSIVFKISYKLFLPHGKDIIFQIKELHPSSEIFLDLKFHDIPNTVGIAIEQINPLPVDYITIHSLAGREVLRRAVEVKRKDLKILAVTLLTSHDDEFLKEIPINLTREELVLKLASLSIESGVDGVVCSGWEVEKIKNIFGKKILTVVPGIRFSFKITEDDQKRIITPQEAVRKGADILVIGRPILNSPNPKETVLKVLSEIDNI